MLPTTALGGLANAVTGFFAVLLAVIVFGAFTIFIVAIGNRTDADPRGARPMAAYLFSAGFLFLWITYFALNAAFDSLIQLIGGHPQTSFFSAPFSYRDAAIRSCVLAAIVLAFAGGSFLLHLHRGTALADTEGDASGPTKRVMRTYVALVCFLSIVIFVVAFIAIFWELFRFIWPGVFLATGSRTATLRSILDGVVLLLLSGWIFSYHQRFAPEGLRLLSRVGGMGTHHLSHHDHHDPVDETAEGS